MERVVRVGKVLVLETVISLVLLCLFALVLQKLQPSERVITTGIKLLYVIVNLIGGLLIGKIMSQKKFLWGVITGFLYFIVISLISFIVHQGFYTDLDNAVTICLLCLAGGMAGGMLGAYIK
ncbi:MAG: TIGR04086 family membrane protein [Lachnospiraceae bacterium]|nr:TIGR04086 family membrane protein [Lachnospiraceae bacterium]